MQELLPASMMCLEIFGTRDSIQLSTCCLEFFISLLRQEHFVLLSLSEPRPCHHRLTSLLKGSPESLVLETVQKVWVH